jgi:formate--tetrahydrofolate ligase
MHNVANFGLNAVVCLNKYTGDTDEEIDFVLSLCKEHGFVAAMADVWSEGGKGATKLAELVVEATEKPGKFKTMYELQESIEEKISAIATQVYHADGVEFSAQAKKEMKWLTKNGYAALPICIAKTQYSFSDNPSLQGAPTGFQIHICQLKISGGAGFIVAISGEILTMPGLSEAPAAFKMNLNREGQIANFY